MEKGVPICLFLSSVCDGEPRSYKYFASFSGKNGRFRISFPEENAETVLLFAHGKLTVKRSDGTELHFSSGKTMPGVFVCPPVSGAVTVKTNKLIYTEESGELELEYALFFGKEPVYCKQNYRIEFI